MRYVLAGWNPAGPTQSTANSSFSVFGAFCVGRPAKYSGSLTDVKGNLITIPDSQIEGGLKIATGSYAGTGTYGSSNSNSLTFDFKPQFVYIWCESIAFFKFTMLYGETSVRTEIGYSSSDRITVTWNDTGFSWYSTSSASKQFNTSGYTYEYIAIGYEE